MRDAQLHQLLLNFITWHKKFAYQLIIILLCMRNLELLIEALHQIIFDMNASPMYILKIYCHFQTAIKKVIFQVVLIILILQLDMNLKTKMTFNIRRDIFLFQNKKTPID